MLDALTSLEHMFGPVIRALFDPAETAITISFIAIGPAIIIALILATTARWWQARYRQHNPTIRCDHCRGPWS